MKKKFIILLINLLFLFFFANKDILAQAASEKEKSAQENPKGTGPETFANNLSSDNDISKKFKNQGNKKEPVKQVKSARPDMKRSHGARPPDIVRPSGSRIPKGVGRPAGAGMRGR